MEKQEFVVSGLSEWAAVTAGRKTKMNGMQTTPERNAFQPQRRAFTLTELLVAIGIIVLMMGLLLGGIGGILGNSREAATRTTLNKVHEILAQQQTEFQLTMTQQPPRRTQGLGPIPDNADPNLKALIERKRLYREAFPQRGSELTDVNGRLTHLGNKVYSIAYNQLSTETGSNPATDQVNARIELMMQQNSNAELLYLILTEGTPYGSTVADGDQLSAREVADTDEDGLLEVVDSWGEPLRFYRWPTRLIRPEYSGSNADPMHPNLRAIRREYWNLVSGAAMDSSALEKDPEDSFSLLSNYLGANVNAFESMGFFTPDTFHTILVISCGPDRELGLYEPNDAENFGHLAQPSVSPSEIGDSTLLDNLTNLQGVR